MPKSHVRSFFLRPISRKFFWVFISIIFILGWIGQNIVESPFIEIGQIATIFYFFYLLILVPGLAWLELFLIKKKTF
jgi:quinol-cytochrome oxidoreductase complex cytochrome b subunit